MIHVIVGDGKGKTSSAVGISVRSAGHGLKVLFMQFLKDDSSGEVELLRKIPGVEVIHCPVNYGFSFQMTDEQKRETAEEYDKMLDRAVESDAFLIVLDEVIHALNVGMIDKEKLERILDKESEIVLTGRDAPEWLIEKADYISDVKKIKHPYDKGIQARIGIEF